MKIETDRERHVLVAPGGQADIDAVSSIERASFAQATFDAAEELARPWARIWVARLDSPSAPPAAFMLAWLVADELHILSLATLPELRRRGLGRSLLRCAIGYAREGGVRLVMLEVRRSNQAAMQLYRGLGFSASGVRHAYYADNDEDAIEMVLALDPSTGEVIPGRDTVRLKEEA